MSVAARVLNVFAVPSATFEDVRASVHSAGTWIVPGILSLVAGVTAFWLTLCQPAALNEFRKVQQENFTKLVAGGKVEQAEADQHLRVVHWMTQPAVARVLSVAMAGGVTTLRMFGWAFLLWLLAVLFLKVRLNFLKTLEVAGLATMVTVVGSIVAVALTTGFARPDPSGSLLSQIDARTKSTPFIVQANVFNIWFVTLLATGLARLAGVRLSQTLLLVMGTWLAVQLAIAILGLGLASLSG